MNISSRTGHTGHDPRHGQPAPPPVQHNAAPDETGEDDVSGYGGASLVGSNVSGLDAARRSTTGTTHDADYDDRDAPARGLPTGTDAGVVAGGLRTHTAGGVSTVGSGATGLNNYSPGSDLGAGLDTLGRDGDRPRDAGPDAEAGGERAPRKR